MANININRLSFAKDKIEESNLRSALLFSNVKDTKSRETLLDKTVFSIIIENTPNCSEDTIVNLFKSRFNLGDERSAISSSIKRLVKMKLINPDGEKYVATDDIKGQKYLSDLEIETNSLIKGIIDKANSVKGVSIVDFDRAGENIRQALSVYFHLYGHSYFETQMSPTEDQAKDATQTASSGFDKKTGDAIIVALADTINNPNEREKNTLEKWAAAFISTQIMGIDPTLRNFKATSLRGKTFVLDTDVVLNCITDNAKYSKDYSDMINKLISIGCKLVIPEDVVIEVGNHADAAIKRARFYKDQLKTFTNDILEGPGSNVFIEDFVKTSRVDDRKKNMSFDDYLYNIYQDDNNEVLEKRLESRFTKEVMNNVLPQSTNYDEIERLANAVNKITVSTAKAENRTDEENYAYSKTDASLYVSVRDKNPIKENSQKILALDYYLVTRTTKTIKCAKEIGINYLDVICKPSILLSVLQEVGVCSTDKVSIINLFENPFLAYSASLIWDEIKELINQGAKFEYRELATLRLDYEVDLHRILTCKTAEERVEVARDITSKGYLFAKDIVESAQREAALQEQLSAKEEELEKAQKTIKILRDKSNAVKTKTRKNIPQKSNRTKKKR